MTGGNDGSHEVPADELSFAAANIELQNILMRIEGDDVDIDRLTSDVRRASELITSCRARISEVEMEIEQIVNDLENGGSATNCD